MRVRVIILILLCVLASAGAARTFFRSTPAPVSPPVRQRPEPPGKCWTFEAGSSVYTTAAVADGRVFFGTSDGRLVALQFADGELLWTYKAGTTLSASPLVVDGAVFIGDEGGVFHAVNAADGRLLWKFTEPKDKILSTAALGPDTVLFGSYDHYLYCVERKTGALRWSFETDLPVHASPCIVGDVAVIAGCDGLARAIRVRDGVQRMSVKLENDLEGNLAAAPAHYDGVVYFGSLFGDYLALRVSDGKVLWRKNEKDGQFFSTAAVTADAAIFSSRSNSVFRVNPANGELVWTFKAKGSVDSSPLILGEVVYVGSDDGNLYALSLADGKERWHFAAGAPIRASPVVVENRLVIGTDDGAVYCFNLAALEKR